MCYIYVNFERRMANETNEERPTPLFRVADEASHPSPTHES